MSTSTVDLHRARKAARLLDALDRAFKQPATSAQLDAMTPQAWILATDLANTLAGTSMRWPSVETVDAVRGLVRAREERAARLVSAGQAAHDAKVAADPFHLL